MIKLSIFDDEPEGAVSRIINGNEVTYYFAEDQETDNDLQRFRIDELQFARSIQKQHRTNIMQRMTVTTASGNTYQADETSQQRMARVVLVMDDADTIEWTLADNTIVPVTRAELREALRLAGQRQSELWQL